VAADVGDVHGHLADEGPADHAHRGVPQRGVQPVLRGAGLVRRLAQIEQLRVDREDLFPLVRLEEAVRVPAVHRLAAQRRRDQEGAVRAGAVGEAARQHEVQQQVGLVHVGALDDPP
jgi:hypothetical protein